MPVSRDMAPIDKNLVGAGVRESMGSTFGFVAVNFSAAEIHYLHNLKCISREIQDFLTINLHNYRYNWTNREILLEVSR